VSSRRTFRLEFGVAERLVCLAEPDEELERLYGYAGAHRVEAGLDQAQSNQLHGVERLDSLDR